MVVRFDTKLMLINLNSDSIEVSDLLDFGNGAKDKIIDIAVNFYSRLAVSLSKDGHIRGRSFISGEISFKISIVSFWKRKMSIFENKSQRKMFNAIAMNKAGTYIAASTSTIRESGATKNSIHMYSRESISSEFTHCGQIDVDTKDAKDSILPHYIRVG